MNVDDRTRYKYRKLFCQRVLDRKRILYNLFDTEQRYDIGHIKKLERIMWSLQLKPNPNTWPYRYWL